MYYLSKAIKMPFSVLCRKIFSLLFSKIEFYYRWFFDICFYKETNLKLNKISLDFEIRSENLEIDKKLLYVIDNYLKHRFDLLGSGWVNVDKKEKMYNSIYNEINWHIDFKSGYLWNHKTWYKFIKYGHIPGVDVKVPWELSRLQHLPQIAILYSSAQCPLEKKDILKIEFENQIIDFIRNNKPRFGVNWVCTMDVAIRVANIVVAYEFFLASGAKFDKNFNNMIINSVYNHGLHIVNNLEWSETLTSNHYLANIVGLLFASSIIKNSEADKWLYFSLNELLNEFEKQYYDDGVNFESSTSYHRLSTEMIAYAASLVLGFNELQWSRIKNTKYHNYNKSISKKDSLIGLENNSLPTWFIRKLFKALFFTHVIMKRNYEIPQFGDNDSGRFFKFSTPGIILKTKEATKKYLNLKNYYSDEELYFDENILDHRSLGIALKSLFDYPISEYKSNLEEYIFKIFSKEHLFVVSDSIFNNKAELQKLGYLDSEFDLQNKAEFVYESLIIDESVLDNISFYSFSDSGFYLFKGPKFYLFIGACPNGQNGNGGHAHNDKLSFELEINGETVFYDPGTYLYTPDPTMRNLFRSVNAHNSIVTDIGEQNEWKPGRFGLFNMSDDSKTRLIYYDRHKLFLEVKYKSVIHKRLFEIKKGKLVITDFCNYPFKQNIKNFAYYSNGYGKLMQIES